MGLGDKENTVYIIDFGLAKQFMNPITQEHIPLCEGKGIVGTANFISANTHAGIEQSRRDDLEAIGYMLVYFAREKLPWQGLYRDPQDKRFKEVMEMKQNINLNLLCTGLPTEFVSYLSYCKGLKFDEKPDYTYLKKLFNDAIVANNQVCDYRFDWLHESEAFYDEFQSLSEMSSDGENLHSNPTRTKLEEKSKENTKTEKQECIKPLNTDNQPHIALKEDNANQNNVEITNTQSIAAIEKGENKKDVIEDIKNTENKIITNKPQIRSDAFYYKEEDWQDFPSDSDESSELVSEMPKVLEEEKEKHKNTESEGTFNSSKGQNNCIKERYESYTEEANDKTFLLFTSAGM